MRPDRYTSIAVCINFLFKKKNKQTNKQLYLRHCKNTLLIVMEKSRYSVYSVINPQQLLHNHWSNKKVCIDETSAAKLHLADRLPILHTENSSTDFKVDPLM